jgi:hypothetical protein
LLLGPQDSMMRSRKTAVLHIGLLSHDKYSLQITPLFFST